MTHLNGSDHLHIVESSFAYKPHTHTHGHQSLGQGNTATVNVTQENNVKTKGTIFNLQ